VNAIQKVRTYGFAIIAVLGFLAFLVGGPRAEIVNESRIDWAGTAQSINSRNSANNNNTSGAPQQTVVNGWTTIDWLELISEQIFEMEQSNHSRTSHDNRVPTLLLLLLLGASLDWATKGIHLENRKVHSELASDEASKL